MLPAYHREIKQKYSPMFLAFSITLLNVHGVTESGRKLHPVQRRRTRNEANVGASWGPRVGLRCCGADRIISLGSNKPVLQGPKHTNIQI